MFNFVNLQIVSLDCLSVYWNTNLTSAQFFGTQSSWKVKNELCRGSTIHVIILVVWRFEPILNAGLQLHSHLSGGLRLRNYPLVAGNHKFSPRFSVFECFYGGLVKIT